MAIAGDGLPDPRTHGAMHHPLARIVPLVALGLVVSVACAEIDGDGALDVTSEWSLGAPLLDRDGGRWTEVRATVALGSIALLACDGSGASDEGWVPTYDQPVGHVASTPTLLGEPALLAVGESVELGRLHPPLGEYCGIELGLFPADDDTAGLDREPSMLGATLSLTGRRDGESRQWRTTVRHRVEHTLDPPLVVDAAHRLHVSLDMAAALAELPADAVDDEAHARALLVALARHAEVRCE